MAKLFGGKSGWNMRLEFASCIFSHQSIDYELAMPENVSPANAAVKVLINSAELWLRNFRKEVNKLSKKLEDW